MSTSHRVGAKDKDADEEGRNQGGGEKDMPTPASMKVATTRGRNPSGEVLSHRALNRATLARQGLLSRWTMPVPEAIERLIGLQSQLPDPSYIGLWTRLVDFRPETLTKALYARQVVRSTMMRYTLHLVIARDLLWLRPILQPVLSRAQRGFFGQATAGMDLAELVAVGRTLFEERPLTPVELRERLHERWPDRDARALAFSVRYLLPLVHMPPGGTWGQNGSFPYTLPESWLGRPLESDPPLARLVLRYLAAFGPATVMDIQQWSGLTRLRAVVEELRPQLRTFRSEAGKELFDLPDAPRPDPNMSAPPRFLPAYDNLMVAYVDRTRLMTDEHRKVLAGMGAGPGEIPATILVDGFVRGTWQIERRPGHATLAIEPFEPLSDQAQNALREEGERLLRAFAVGTETLGIQWCSQGSEPFGSSP